MSKSDDTRLQQVIARLAAQSRVGMAVAVIAKNRVRFVGGFGVRSTSDRVPVTADTLFYTASVSKLVTATAVLQLVERKLLALDGFLTTYLPALPLADERARAINIRHLLTHTSGLPDVDDYGWDAPELDDHALERFVYSQARRMLLFSPGSDFAYSNLAYSMLGAIVSAVTGQSFEDYVHAHVFAPLGMWRSTLFHPDLTNPQTALPHLGATHVAPASIYPYHRVHGPSSNFHTTAHDLCVWMRVHLAQGTGAGPHILRPATYREMWQPIWALDAQRAMGLGWFLVGLNGIRWIGHGGHDPGFRAVCLLAPEIQGGVAALTNDDEVDMDDLAISLSVAMREVAL